MLAALGTERAWVVHGEDGLDEITLAGKTHVAEAQNGEVKTFEIGPEDFGFEVRSLDHLRGGDTEANAAIVSAVLDGSRKDEARALVMMNAAAALLLGRRGGGSYVRARSSRRTRLTVAPRGEVGTVDRGDD